MRDSERGMWVLVLAFVAAFCLLLGFFVGQASGQAPPVSTVTDVTMLQEEGDYTGEVLINFEASCPGEWVGIYYRIEDVTDGWLYCWHDPVELVWAPPVWDRVYQFASHVTCDGVEETYPHDRPEPQHEYEIFLTMETAPADSCDLSLLEHVAALASMGFDLEADTPALMWHWTHPTTGSPVVEYIAEWWVDGVSSTITGIAVGDTTFAFWESPYTVGQTQKLRVQGKDAQDRAGPWSLWSDEWVDQGPPGAPPAPSSTLIMID